MRTKCFLPPMNAGAVRVPCRGHVVLTWFDAPPPPHTPHIRRYIKFELASLVLVDPSATGASHHASVYMCVAVGEVSPTFGPA
jgi:hypothetical protein